MKKRRILLGLALASLFTFSLSACGEEDKPTDPTSQTDDKPAENKPVDNTPDVDPVVEEFDVYFNSNGGTAVNTASVKKGEKVTKPADPTRTSAVATHEFGGWFTDAACTQAYDFNTAVTADITLYAKWTSTLVEATKITMNGTEYDNIKSALAAIPTNSKDTFTIILPKGEYNENGLIYNGSATVKIVGATDTKYGADVVIKGHGDNMTQENAKSDNNWQARNLLTVQGSANIILENLTLESDWTRQGAAAAGIASNTQAEVLGTSTTGNTVAYNCGFKSHQDTLRTTGKAWFYGCYIEGDVDFIWMEEAGSVALYEKCEIVSVYDATASSHASYVTAPRMAINSKAGKGLVIYNSTVKESAEAKEKGQTTYLGRTPWPSGYFSQVSYINTTCSDIEASVWSGSPIPTEFERTVIGWKMDKATATSLNYTGSDILDDETTETEFGGRRTILNRIFNCGKLKYEKDTNVWDIDAVIADNGYAVDYDFSSDVIEGETAGEPVIYKFDDTEDVTSLVDGFSKHSSGSYVGNSGATITIPVAGKCYVEVYGFYSGTVETKADTQGEAIMFFNNGSTSKEMLNTYTVYDANAKTVTISAKATTYITKVVVTPDTAIENTLVSDITVSKASALECVGVSQTLIATVTPGNATNKSVKWSSSDPEVADIDAYTGKVTFKKEGTVEFTATACDGSGKTATFTCNPKDPKWTQCEWFTTDSAIAEEKAKTVDKDNGDGTTTTIQYYAADGIENFSYGASTVYKSLGKEFTFKNLAGNTITTKNGLKLNSKGELIIATTKPNAILTVVIAHIGSVKATPSVKSGDTTVTPTSVVEAADGTTTTYEYYLENKGLWSITRGDGSSENDPLLYASCVYDTDVITRNTTFVLGKDNSALVDACDTTGVIQKATAKVGKFTIDATNGKLRLNGPNNAQINTGTKIKFTVAAGSKVIVSAYDLAAAKAYTINGVGTNAKVFERYYATETEVEILLSGNVYLEQIEVVANATAPAAPTLDSLEISGYTADEIAVGTDYELPALTVKAVYDDNSVYTLDATDYTVDNNIDKTTAGTYQVTVTYNDGTTEKTASYDVKYVASVSNVISEAVTFTDSYTGVTKVEKSTATFGKFSVDATTGKLAPNNGNFQFNNTTTITFTVAAGATVTVTGYPNMSNYSLTGSSEANATQVKTVTYATETPVTVAATGDGYIISIAITFE